MQLESEDQIDIVALIAKVWKSKKLILKSILVFGVLGAFGSNLYFKSVYGLFYVYPKL